MFESFKTLPLLGLAAACAATGAAQAQWFPPPGAAPPEAIVQRLHAQGYSLIGPIRRNQTVLLADVNAGTTGRERLVIDAYSGEILQRFVAMPRSSRPIFGGYVAEGGEFSAPSPLGPPPARDFYSPPGNFAYGAPSGVEIRSPLAPVGPREAKPKLKPRPHGPAEMKHARSTPPSEQAAKPPEVGATQARHTEHTTAAPAGAGVPSGSPPAAGSARAAPKSAATAAPAPAAVPDRAAAVVPGAPTETQAKNVVGPQPAAAPQPAEKGSSEKSRVNDVPVNPLE
jgi:hypothetical protein